MDIAAHGPEYIKVLLNLVQRCLGDDQKRALKDILIKHGIKTKTVTDETRAKQRSAWIQRQAPRAKKALLDILKEFPDDED